MTVNCEKAGTREKCSTCDHGKPHEYLVRLGCEHGRCLPNMAIANTITGEMIDTKQNYHCVEAPIITEEKNVETETVGNSV